MMWAIPVGMAALGAINGAQQRQADRRWNESQAEVTRYSPWTGMSGQMERPRSSALSGALSGGAMGLSLYQGLSGSGSPKTKGPDVSTSGAQVAAPGSLSASIPMNPYMNEPEWFAGMKR